MFSSFHFFLRKQLSKIANKLSLHCQKAEQAVIIHIIIIFVVVITIATILIVIIIAGPDLERCKGRHMFNEVSFPLLLLSQSV